MFVNYMGGGTQNFKVSSTRQERHHQNTDRCGRTLETTLPRGRSSDGVMGLNDVIPDFLTLMQHIKHVILWQNMLQRTQSVNPIYFLKSAIRKGHIKNQQCCRLFWLDAHAWRRLCTLFLCSAIADVGKRITSILIIQVPLWLADWSLLTKVQECDQQALERHTEE